MSQQWKAFERDVAEVLGGNRVVRGDYGESDFDVRVRDFHYLKVDAKRYKRHAHHTLLKKVKEKYCGQDGAVPVLCTRENGSPFTVASLPLRALGNLLDEIRELRQERDNLQHKLEMQRIAGAL